MDRSDCHIRRSYAGELEPVKLFIRVRALWKCATRNSKFRFTDYDAILNRHEDECAEGSPNKEIFSTAFQNGIAFSLSVLFAARRVLFTFFLLFVTFTKQSLTPSQMVEEMTIQYTHWISVTSDALTAVCSVIWHSSRTHAHFLNID